MLPSIKTFLKEQGVADDHRFFVAVSGGVDSVVLSHLCSAAGLSFEILHCNYRLRGEESDADAAFVKNWATQLGVKSRVKIFDVAAHQALYGGGIQEAARNLRYEWFDELAATNNSFYLLAHQQDDVAETVLMNLTRGTGLHGLTGMGTRTPSGKGLRPLLAVSRKDILAYAEAHQIHWREDASNQKDDYTRNFFRLNVLPLLQQVHPAATANITATAQRLKQTEALYDPLLQSLKKKTKQARECWCPLSGEAVIDLSIYCTGL